MTIIVLFGMCATNVAPVWSTPGIRLNADKLLPERWKIKSVMTESSPYGYLAQEGLGGLQIHLVGSAEVADKGKLKTTESITLWFMPVKYLGNSVPKPGTPHRPAKLIGGTAQFRLYALPWNATPTWQKWNGDLLKHYKIKPNSNEFPSPSHDQLTQECKMVLQGLQDRFERTATYHGMKPLREWFFIQLETLSSRYSKQIVTDTMNRLAVSGIELKHPVPEIAKNYLKEYNVK